MKKLVLFLFNSIYFYFFLINLFQSDSSVSETVIQYIQDDSIKIGLSPIVNINYILISVILSILVSFFLYFYVFRRYPIKSALEVISIILNILFIHLGVVFFFFYLLRFYNFSRGLILIYTFLIVVATFLLITLLFLEESKIKNIKKVGRFVPPILVVSGILITAFIFVNSDNDAKYVLPEVKPIEEIENISPEFGVINEDCKRWRGSENFKECVVGISISSFAEYEGRLTNVVTYNNKIFILESNGKIYNVSDQELFIDLSEKVTIVNESIESGLLSLAFHPNENYFLLSYTDSDNNLVVEKHLFNSELQPIVGSSEIIKKIPSPHCCHYSGNLIWSFYFQDFLLSVGDMEDNPLLSSVTFDTTNPKGKIIFVNKNLADPDLLSVDKNQIPRNDILAFGLRNPWKTYEFENFLFVPDVGMNYAEELNVVNLDDFSETKKPYLFGFPYFEAYLKKDIYYNEILLHNDNESVNIRPYIMENTHLPEVYYLHQGPENYRAAIIGGGVIADKSSKYYKKYFFADYLSNELFMYDFINDELTILPLGNLNSYITSLAINPNEKDTILIATGSGKLINAKLP